jgi:hypothetical protein
MSLPLKAVDRLFDRLIATYGRDFSSKWEGLDQAAIKTSWSHELYGFTSNLGSLAWALENLPERAPNVIEFRNLARRAPATPEKQLPAPKADPERVAAELAKLAPIRRERNFSGDDGKDWARRLVARHQAGERLRPIQIRFAHEALRITP